MAGAAFQKNDSFILAGGILLDRKNHIVSVEDRKIKLTPSVMRALDLFMRLKDIILSPQEFYREYSNQRKPVNDRQANLLTRQMVNRICKIYGSDVIRNHEEQGYSFAGLIPADQNEFINYWGLLFSPSTNCVSDGVSVYSLQRAEAKILFAFVQEPDRVFAHMELGEMIWPQQDEADDPSVRTIDVHISKLRKIIGHQYIQTVRAGGYRFGPNTP